MSRAFLDFCQGISRPDTVSVAYPLSDIPRPLHGYSIPRAEGRAILACTWTSTKLPHSTPEGYGLIRAFIGRAGQGGTLIEERLAKHLH